MTSFPHVLLAILLTIATYVVIFMELNLIINESTNKWESDIIVTIG